MSIQTREVLTCPTLCVQSAADLSEHILRLVNADVGGYSVAINAEKIMMYKSQPAMKKAIDQSILPSPDGISVVIGLKWLYGMDTVRVDLPNTILELANRESLRIYLLGASEESNRRAAENVAVKHPNLSVAGRHHGYFESLDPVSSDISRVGPHFVFVALGSPKQELLMMQLHEHHPHTLFLGCGGAIDIMAGRVKRAPEIYQKYGLEWLYRLMQRPSLIKRKWVYLPFMLELIGQSIKKKFVVRD